MEVVGYMCRVWRLEKQTIKSINSFLMFRMFVVGGAVTSCARISAAFVCTSSSKQIYHVSIQSDFLAGEVSNHLGLSPDSLSMFFDVHP